MASIVDQEPYNEYTGNGSSTVYPYTFQLLRESHLSVFVDGTEVSASEYSVSGVGVQAGGTVTFDTAPADDTTILIRRDVPFTRSTAYTTNGPFPATTVNLDFNLIWQALQGLGALYAGVLRAPYPEAFDEMPSKDDLAGRLLAFNGSGEPAASSVTMAQLESTVAAAYTGAAGPLDALSFVQAGTGMVSRSAQAKQRERLSLLDAAGDDLTSSDDINAFLLTASAAAVAGSTASKTIRLPAGEFRLNSGITLGNGVSLVGDGSIGTVINFHGSGYAITANGPRELVGFKVVGQAAGQSGLWIKGSTFAHVRDVSLREFDTVGARFGDTASSGCYFTEVDGLEIRNQTLSGAIGLWVDGGGVASSNANTFRNVHVARRFSTHFHILGNDNVFITSDAAPENSVVAVDELFNIEGDGNVFESAYIEPIDASYPDVYWRFSGNGNRFQNAYVTSVGSTNSYSKIVDTGTNNDVEISAISANFPQSAGVNSAQVNWVPNSRFTNLKADGLPVGWLLTGTGSAARNAVTVRGQPYSMALTVAAQNASLTSWIATSNPGARLPLQTIPVEKLLNRTVTVGAWCWSSQAGLGAVKLYSGAGDLGNVSHSGSSAWEFLAVSGRVDSAATEVALRLRTDSANANRTGTCYFSEPVFVIGHEIPQCAPPRPLPDGDAALAGRLTLSPWFTFASGDATPDVSEGNLFKTANAGATTITQFDGAREGQEIKLLAGDANTTLKNNSTIVTTTGADKALTSGVIYKLVYDAASTKWREF